MSAEDLKNNISSVNAEETATSDEKKERRKRKPRTVRKNKKTAKPKKQKSRDLTFLNCYALFLSAGQQPHIFIKIRDAELCQ